ncbi:hypothetical protein [Vibrio sp.]|uniref:hypothetical protein n=1 Tax=Vibrio sp. TaxID=678 RepID=UPI00311F35BB
MKRENKMAGLGYCKISDLKLNQKSKRAVTEVKEIMSSGNMLASALSATPFYYIFGTPSMTKTPYSMMLTIREHDWEMFGKLMGSVPSIVKSRIHFVASQMSWETAGKEKKFWECVSNAAI